MAVPEHLWRFPTREAINSLACRFDLPNTPEMQDWEWEVADANRINEFVVAYEGGSITEDERFTLMETIIQSFAEADIKLDSHPDWQRVSSAIDQNISLHIYSVWYWADLENTNDEDIWNVTPFMRAILETHRKSFERE